LPIYIYEPTIWSENEEVRECCSFEILQSFKEDPLKKCPTCGHEIHRAVTSFNVSSKVSVNLQNNETNNGSFYSLFDKKKDSPAAKAAQLAMRHICQGSCKH
jgi:putative FmdB family regulatory protein